MARQQVEYNPRAEALQTTAAPSIKTVQARFDPRESSAFQLAEALGKVEPIIDKWREDQKREKLQQDILQLPALQEKFKREFQNGAVTATQVGAARPDTSDIVKARIAEGIGGDHGKEQIQALINEVSQNAELLQDNDKRAAYVNQKKQEIFGKLGGDNFYKSGFIAAVDKELNQWENGWQRQTTKYQTEVQERDFSNKVAEGLASKDPTSVLSILDDGFAKGSSLNNIRRKELVVETAINMATQGTGNPDILDRIPDKFLNAELKSKIADTKKKIEQYQMSRYRFGKELETEQRKENVRAGKLEILKEFSSGRPVNPFKYQDPELFDYASGMMNAPRVPKATSAASYTQIRETILSSSTVGTLDQNTVIDQILRNPNINADDKSKLIEEAPKLLQGRLAMQDPRVKAALDTRIEARLKALEGSTNARIQTLLSGRNLRAEVMKTFDVGVRNSFEAYYQSNNQTWPTGLAAQEIVDRETEKAEKLLESLTSVKSLQGNQGQPTAAPAASAPAQQSRPGVKRYNPATGKIE